MRLGEWDTASEDSAYPHQDIRVERMVLHEKFDDASLINDVALLKLEEPAEIAPHVNTMCLPPDDDYYIDYTDCVANGWGKTSFGKSTGETIHLVDHCNFRQNARGKESSKTKTQIGCRVCDNTTEEMHVLF